MPGPSLCTGRACPRGRSECWSHSAMIDLDEVARFAPPASRRARAVCGVGSGLTGIRPYNSNRAFPLLRRSLRRHRRLLRYATYWRDARLTPGRRKPAHACNSACQAVEHAAPLSSVDSLRIARYNTANRFPTESARLDDWTAGIHCPTDARIEADRSFSAFCLQINTRTPAGSGSHFPTELIQTHARREPGCWIRSLDKSNVRIVN